MFNHKKKTKIFFHSYTPRSLYIWTVNKDGRKVDSASSKSTWFCSLSFFFVKGLYVHGVYLLRKWLHLECILDLHLVRFIPWVQGFHLVHNCCIVCYALFILLTMKQLKVQFRNLQCPSRNTVKFTVQMAIEMNGQRQQNRTTHWTFLIRIREWTREKRGEMFHGQAKCEWRSLLCIPLPNMYKNKKYSDSIFFFYIISTFYSKCLLLLILMATHSSHVHWHTTLEIEA